MKKLKWIGLILLVFIVSCVSCFKFISKDMPIVDPQENAELLADKVLEALNQPAWDSLAYIKWTFFFGKHHYHWDKKQNRAIVEWKKNKVLLDLDQVDGDAYSDGKLVTGEEKSKLIQKAWNIWCNDSFWLCAPYKIKDPGTSRSVVSENGKKGLKIEYESGGVTPGDIYVWWLDEDYMPNAWQMWVQILPFKGVRNTWQDWKDINGAKIAVAHKSAVGTAKLSNVEGGMSIADIGLTKGAFELK